jgi:hypothetical protein
MGMLRVLDGEMVQAELVLHAVQQLRIGLQEAYPDDMALLVGPISGIIDGNIGDAPAIGIDAGGETPGVPCSDDDASGARLSRAGANRAPTRLGLRRLAKVRHFLLPRDAASPTTGAGVGRL